MSVDKKDLANKFFDAGLITLGACVLAFASKKAFGTGLGVPMTAEGVAKLVGVMGLSGMGVHYLQTKEYVPNDPFK